jgi:NAD-dependent SIR2 family protein deacetylase
VGVSETVTCAFCGTQAPEAEALTWTSAVERGRRVSYCDSCSRTHLRAMESKLDSEWW